MPHAILSLVNLNLAKSRPTRCRAKHEAFILGPERAVCQIAMVDEQEISELCVARSSPKVCGRAEAKNAK